MSKDHYQHTELQKKFLALLPVYKGDFDEFWQSASTSINKIALMVGRKGSSYEVQSTDIGKLIFRVYCWLKPLVEECPENWKNFLAEPPTSWADVDLSRYHSELLQANPWFGFGASKKGEYEAAVERTFREAKQVGLGAGSFEDIEALLENAKKYVSMHRIMERLMAENGIDFNQEALEMASANSYKRMVAEIMLEDCEHKILDWFERIFLDSDKKLSLEGLEGEEFELCKLFVAMQAEYQERKEAQRGLR